MAFGRHWEWRGFGPLSRELRAALERLPRKFPASQRVTDTYLFVPGSTINVKLREDFLKFKRLLETREGLECWLEDEAENHPFPLGPELVLKLAAELGIEPGEPGGGARTPADLVALLAERSAGVRVIPVEKERWQYEWSTPAAPAPVTVELAEISIPESVLSLGIEHPDAAPVAACRSALGLPGSLRAANYLDALAAWAAGGGVS